jgi:hypothetical protein
METDDELFSLAFKAMLLDKMNTAEYITSVERVDDTLVFGFKSANKVTIDLPKGETGAPGESIQGERGLDGLNGKDGIDGRDGVDGQPGTDGSNGKDGIDGINGLDGSNGKDGRDGIDGLDGKKGANGTRGKDGLEGNGITDVYIDNKKHLIIVTRDKIYDAGKIKSGGGGGGSSITEFKYTNSAPMPMSVGGFPEGTTFDNVSLQDLWTGLLYSNAGLPSFSEFDIDIALLPPVLEVGQSIAAGDYFAEWTIINPMLLLANSIVITYVNGNLVLADHIDNTGQYEVTLPEIFFTTPTVISFKIEANNTLGDTFMKTFDTPVQDRVFVGESSLGVLGQSDIKALRISELKENINGDYAMVAGGYKWFCYPTSMGTRVNFIDTDTGIEVPMMSPEMIDITNSYAVTQSYYCYRTFYELNGAIKITVK